MPELKAVITDVDGVVAETEDYHRKAYNQLFKDLGLSVYWDRKEYMGRLAQLGGTKFYEIMEWIGTPKEEREQRRLELYAQKTETFVSLISHDLQCGTLSPRPGVLRLCREILDRGLILGAASTSVKEAAMEILRHALGEEIFGQLRCVCAGDDVQHKKPAPDIYFLAAETCGVAPENCLAIEDTEHGMQAALDAGMCCMVTPSEFTTRDTFSGAHHVQPDLESPTLAVADLTRIMKAGDPT